MATSTSVRSRSGLQLGSTSALPFLLVLFIGSGCSALIYEIVWFQLLRLVIGSSAISIGVLLGTFMGGMCLGSLLLPRWISAKRHPLRVYAVLEILIGLVGLALLWVMPLIGKFYLSAFGHGLVDIMLRGLISAVCLLPPTIMMGATLPAIARWVEADRRGVSWLGFFYGANIGGAVFGCLLAGFYLLRVFDVTTATVVAFCINLAVFLIGLLLAQITPHRIDLAGGDTPDASPSTAPLRPTVYVAIALSGLTSLGAEVVWTRQLSLLLGASVYTFSIILAVFLTGLGMGSTFGASLSRRMSQPIWAFGVCQGLLGLAIAWAAYVISSSLPYWPINPSWATDPWVLFQLDILRCFWAMFPSAFLWGASFPLALASATDRRMETGKLVGGMYAANTVGAIVGAVGVSMIMIQSVGTQKTHAVLIGLAALSSLLLFVPMAIRAKALQTQCVSVALSLAVFVLAWVTIQAIPAAPPGLIAYGRHLPSWIGYEPDYLYTAEGMNASIAVSKEIDDTKSDGTMVRNFHVSGKVVASSDPSDMRLQRMLGHLPAMMHGDPKSALVVGCGAGVTSGSFLVHPGFERVVICEIEPLIPPAAGKYFSAENHGVIDDERTEIFYDDARHFVATTKEKFDIITSDPIHPWVKGAAALYSREYYELCKARLNDGGFITQWVPLYESNEAAVKSEIATFLEVFPHGTVWGNDINGGGYDIVMLAQVGESTIDLNAIQERLDREEYQQVVVSLSEVGLGTALRIAAKYAGDAESMQEWLADAEINSDRNLRLQYLAGLSLNAYEEEDIYRAMLKKRRYPARLFVTNEGQRQSLMRMLENTSRID